MFRLVIVALIFAGAAASGAGIPGVEVELIANASGFVTSIAIDREGRIHYSSRDGSVWRIEEGQPVFVTSVDTADQGNAALLGIAFAPDGSIVTHHVLPDLSGDVIARIDPETGVVDELARFLCGGTLPCPTEHHGGNPIVAPDGSIFVAIGDLGSQTTAQRDDSIGGKIYRISSEGVERWALGFRNPFDLAWDERSHTLFAGDNGAGVSDEVNEIVRDGNFGWPWTAGYAPPVEGTIAPVHTFPVVVAPTGMCALGGQTPVLRRGLLVATFVTSSIEWFPSLAGRPLGDPVPLVQGEKTPMIDVMELPEGGIVFATTGGIWRVVLPEPGDVNGDRVVDGSDVAQLVRELLDGDGNEAAHAMLDEPRSTLGADVNGDGFIDHDDLGALVQRVTRRPRGVRRP